MHAAPSRHDHSRRAAHLGRGAAGLHVIIADRAIALHGPPGRWRRPLHIVVGGASHAPVRRADVGCSHNTALLGAARAPCAGQHLQEQ